MLDRRLLVILVVACQLGMPAFSLAAGQSSSDSLASLEQRFFSRTYKSESDNERLERLEKLVFGTASSGPEDQRLKKLKDSVVAADAAIADAASGRAPQSSEAPQSGETPQSAERPTSDSSKTAESQSPVDAGTDYPAVDDLEKRLLGQINGARPLRARLAELERKAFGHVSTDPDLSNRVQALQDYAQGSRSTASSSRGAAGQITPFSDDDDFQFPDERRAAAPRFNDFPTGGGLLGDGGVSRGPAAPGDVAPRGLTNTISGLEKQIFGKISKEPLPERLSKLEDSVFPNDDSRHEGSVIERTARLAEAIDGSRATAGSSSLSSAPSPSRLYGAGVSHMQQFPQMPDLGSDQDPLADYGGATANGGASSTQPSKGKSFLHGLSKALQVAGLAAAATLGAVGSGMSYSPYSGYGYGYGMPYGGYYSPYGSMYSPSGSMFSPYGTVSPYGGAYGYGLSPFGTNYGISRGIGLGGLGMGTGLGGFGMGTGLGGLGMGIGGFGSGMGMGIPMMGF